MMRRWAMAACLLGPLMLSAGPALAQDAGLVTRAAPHTVADTLQRLRQAIQGIGWVVFGEVDHTAAARTAGMELRARTVVLFGNPKGGTPPMRSHPTLALDLPMRMLVWEDDQGRTMVTRSTGADIAQRVFARHGVAVDAQGQAGTERILDDLMRKAIE